jgi:hypothetical protein
MFRLLRWLFFVGTAYIVVQTLPDLARYLRMRSL